MTSQFAHRRGVKTISVIRERSSAELEEVKGALLNMGSTMVLTEGELEGNEEVKSKPIKLALDSVFGASGRGLMKVLSTGGTYVQLGFLGGSASQHVLEANDIFGRQITMKAFVGLPKWLRGGRQRNRPRSSTGSFRCSMLES